MAKDTILRWVIEWGGDSCIQEVDETTDKIINQEAETESHKSGFLSCVGWQPCNR